MQNIYSTWAQSLTRFRGSRRTDGMRATKSKYSDESPGSNSETWIPSDGEKPAAASTCMSICVSVSGSTMDKSWVRLISHPTQRTWWWWVCSLEMPSKNAMQGTFWFYYIVVSRLWYWCASSVSYEEGSCHRLAQFCSKQELITERHSILPKMRATI